VEQHSSLAVPEKYGHNTKEMKLIIAPLDISKWRIVCRPKDQRRIFVHDLQAKKNDLLGKFLSKLLTEDVVGKPF
jgi:hypothetical protein